MPRTPRALERTPVVRNSADPALVRQRWEQKLLLDEQIAALTKQRTVVHEDLHNWAAWSGRRDSKGSQRVTLDTPVASRTATSRGFVRQRNTSNHFDVDGALRLADSLGVRDRVIKRRVIEEVDPDEFWALFQEGLIERAAIDALIITEHTYSIRGIS